jgi:hypothetical protein
VATRGIAIGLERVAVERVAGEDRRVDAARERAAFADHDERSQLRVVAQLFAELAQLAPHLGRERVQPVRA